MLEFGGVEYVVRRTVADRRVKQEGSGRRPQGADDAKRPSEQRPWYAAQLLFVAKIDGQLPADALAEESVRVLRAASPEEAAERAGRIGLSASHAYGNADGQSVEWVFVRVLEVQALCENELVDGVEVFSTLRRVESGDAPIGSDGR